MILCLDESGESAGQQERYSNLNQIRDDERDDAPAQHSCQSDGSGAMCIDNHEPQGSECIAYNQAG